MLPPELQQKLAPLLQQLEQYRHVLHVDEQQARKQARKKTKWAVIIWSVFLMAMIDALWMTGFSPVSVLMIAAASISLFVVFIYATKSVFEFATAYEDAYKTEINNAIVRYFSPALSYIVGEGISRDAFVSSNLFTRPNRYGTSDLVSGVYGKTQIVYSGVS